MATYTTHYNFPKYEAGDLPNLLDQYNNFADGADSQLYTQSQAVTTAQTAATNAQTAAEKATAAGTAAQEKADEVAELVGEQTGTGTVFAQLDTLNTQYSSMASEVNAKAPIMHASAATTYGVASSSQFGHVKVSTNITSNVSETGTALAQSAGVTLNNLISQAQSDANAAIVDAANAVDKTTWTTIADPTFGVPSTQTGTAWSIPADCEAHYVNGFVIWAFHVHVQGNTGSSYPQSIDMGTIPVQYRPAVNYCCLITASTYSGVNTGLVAGFAQIRSDGGIRWRVGRNDDYFGVAVWYCG